MTGDFAVEGELLAEQLGPDGRRFLELSTVDFGEPTLESVHRVHQARWAAAQAWRGFMEEYPIIVGPTWTQRPFAHGFDIDRCRVGVRTSSRWSASSLPANALGLPAACVPTGVVDGLPTGVQVIGTGLPRGHLPRRGRGDRARRGRARLRSTRARECHDPRRSGATRSARRLASSQAGSFHPEAERPDDADAYWAAVEETRERGGDVLVAIEDGEVVGVAQVIVFPHFQRVGGRCAEVESVHVCDPTGARAAIGAALLEAAEELARERGCYRIQLTSRNAARSTRTASTSARATSRRTAASRSTYTDLA